jgi:hypothetical protein
MKQYNEENIDQFIPITPITDAFESEKELVEYANKNVDKVIAHNLFCLSENVNILTNLIAVLIGNAKDKQPEKPKPVQENAPWIYAVKKT